MCPIVLIDPYLSVLPWQVFGLFPSWELMQILWLWTFLTVFGAHTHTFLFDTYLGVELLGIRIFFSLPLVNTTKEFSTVTELRISSVDESFHCLASLLTPGSLRISSVDESFHCIASLLTPSSLRISSVYESFHCMASLLTPGSLQVFYSSHFGGCEEVAGWGFWFVLFSFFSWLVLIWFSLMTNEIKHPFVFSVHPICV